MNLEEHLIRYKRSVQVKPKEENIQETIRKSKEVFYAAEQNEILTYREFLWIQLKCIQKKWWLFQMLLLFALWFLLPVEQEDYYIQRSVGVIASLFVILIIPELWKSRTCQCIEIEASSYYSLRQIYAARMLLFGIVDMLLITVFCRMASITLHFTLSELLIQFLFPMVVTACICFGILCSKYSFSEVVAVSLCIIWSAIWWRIILIDRIYTIIALPIWIILFASALIFLSVTVYRTLNCYNKCWEVNFNEVRDK